jgi:myelin regulatory factor
VFTRLNCEQLDTRQQLANIARLRLVRFAYRDQYADYAGLSEDQRRLDTGVIAQEVREILPDAVDETGDVVLANGETITSVMVVNKVNTCLNIACQYFSFLW